VSSPATIYPRGTYTLLWTGSNYVGTQDKDAPVTVPAVPTVLDDFVFVSGIGSTSRTAYYSQNAGSTWTSATGYDGPHRPTWTGSNWISPIRRSGNGINWRATSGLGAPDNGASTVGWNGKVAVFYTTYTQQLKTSTDGSNWFVQNTGTVFSSAGVVDDITWGQDKFMATIGGTNRTYHYAYSFDASTWYAGNLIWASNGLFIRPTRIRWNGNYWLAGGSSQNGVTGLARSYDGFTWANVGSINSAITGLDWNGDIWLASSQGGLWTSPDGTTWTSSYPSSIFNNGNGGDVAWSGSYWYALGCNAAGTNWAVIRSQDGANWSLMTTFADGGNVFGPCLSTRWSTPLKPATPPNLPLVVSEISGTSLAISTVNSNRSFYLTNSGFNAVTLPSTVSNFLGGSYWSLRNSTASQLTITLTNTLNLTSPLIIPSSNTQTLVVSRDTSNTILLL
jgi:hypothetical protein